MKRGRYSSGPVRLRPDQAERTDVFRVTGDDRGQASPDCRRRIAPVIDDHRLALAPSIGRRHVPTARHIGETALALPPELVRVANALQGCHWQRLLDIGHVPDLVSRLLGGISLDVAQQVDVAGHPAGQLGAEAHARHLRLTSLDGDRNMEGLLRPLRIGDVDDHRAVRLQRAALERVGLDATVRAHERDGLAIRIDDDVRLVRGPELQIDVADPFHVFLLAALAVELVGQDVASYHRSDRQRHADIHVPARDR